MLLDQMPKSKIKGQRQKDHNPLDQKLLDQRPKTKSFWTKGYPLDQRPKAKGLKPFGPKAFELRNKCLYAKGVWTRGQMPKQQMLLDQKHLEHRPKARELKAFGALQKLTAHGPKAFDPNFLGTQAFWPEPQAKKQIVLK